MPEIVERLKPVTATVKDIARRFFRHENAALAVVLIALIGGLSIVTKGLTISRDNMMNVLLQSSVRGPASIGQAFVILSGGIDLSVGGMGLMIAIVGASMMTEAPYLNIVGYPVSMYGAIPVMLLVGVGFGALNGTLVSRIGMPALIVTLGMWYICKGLGFRISQGQTVTHLPDSLLVLGQGKVAGVPVPVIIFIAVGVVAYFVLNHTTFGRSIYGVGGNPIVAWFSGVPVKPIRFSVYAISGFLSGLTAVVVTARTMSTSMKTLEFLELDTIAAVCIGGVSLMGGKGNIIGVVLGTLIFGFLTNAMNVLGREFFLENLIRGAIIITAVAVDHIRKR